MAKAYARMGGGDSPKPITGFDNPRKLANCGGNRRMLTFHTGTLGIDFRDNLVVSVADGGQAVTLGVRAGWRIVEVGGETVVESKDIVKAINTMKKETSRFDILFATPKWVKIGIPDEIGGGFLTIKVADGTMIYQLKKQILKRCKIKRVSIVPTENRSGQTADMHHTCFVITDGTKELTSNEIFDPEAHHIGSIKLVRISVIRESAKKVLAPKVDLEKFPEEDKPPPMVALFDSANKEEAVSTTPKSPKMEFVRVSIPKEAGGGFITLRVATGTSASELRDLALEKVQKKTSFSVAMFPTSEDQCA